MSRYAAILRLTEQLVKREVAAYTVTIIVSPSETLYNRIR